MFRVPDDSIVMGFCLRTVRTTGFPEKCWPHLGEDEVEPVPFSQWRNSINRSEYDFPVILAAYNLSSV